MLFLEDPEQSPSHVFHIVARVSLADCRGRCHGMHDNCIDLESPTGSLADTEQCALNLPRRVPRYITPPVRSTERLISCRDCAFGTLRAKSNISMHFARCVDLDVGSRG